ncbi:UDP-N-acetylmuramoyl-L-alanine--D-glutamate ligase [Sulfurimonas sp. C5]|uniref:UDP-N-acetylmuramoyl-L-alanine--D-glutamate ligase n=1 Tax=Sulfurimonas sp. C5 TaxID=3036947 RepID=UPI0024543558|nr:UDP-N-acetylmuramoyl-L-alanine--D-glutamate ligase [Sulfurimonas sp. C5]MDH4944980.1 UDP-N-acetylmuramoyl-L-alanine--D-glutamate ligase [Sulfurimonas sp. C5]
MKRISLFGYGVTTKALGHVLKNAVFYDDNVKEPYFDENNFIVRPSSEFNPDFSDLEIPSPGMPPHHKLIESAKHLISEYDYFKDVMNLKIWISGTNGKTTTTQMTQHLLADKGGIAGGNIGTPLAALDAKAPIWILETSSFTIHYTNEASPNIYVLLPLSPDHLSWHGSMQEYIDAKLKPLKLMKKGSTAIIPEAYKDATSAANIITYKDEADLAEQFGINIEKVNFKGAFLMDALLAMSVDKIVFDRIEYEKINTFVLDPHRQEEFYDAQKRLWVNDTKATNLDATIAAVKRYEDHFIHLILGGDDKGVDLNELFVFLQRKNLKIYAIGSNKERLMTLAQNYGVAAHKCKDLVDAVNIIDHSLKESEVALLSPAAASLDEFQSYAHRGNLFKESVAQL